jgi:hypothetical protein
VDQDILDDSNYTTLLEIDTFRVVKDEKFDESPKKGRNNSTPHWIAHMCDAYKEHSDNPEDPTGAFDADEIRQGNCYYCKVKIPEPIIALWSMLEWEEAGDILHDDDQVELYNVIAPTARGPA